MTRAFLQLAAMIAVFFGLWFGLSQIDWVGILRIESGKEATEEKLGDLLWDTFKQQDEELRSSEVTSRLDSLIQFVCKENNIDAKEIKLHVLQNDDVNAVTLPDHHLVVYSGLIKASDSEAELVGVICHEIAHMQKNHVMKKLVKEIGLSALIGMTSGGNTGRIIKLISSSAYDRELETEADLTAADYMLKADLDPEALANFLYKLSSDDVPSQVYWVSTHPESKERAKAIIEYIEGKDITKNQILSADSWKSLKAAASEN
ncbi:M48 family metallopeptidase [Pseudochryseolinea flava]|uniref:Peptidase M48 n=1 Tax=Pseudochryseolinea flava TaxID=2059302 RepID=A0A364Y0Y3_9BACT|nr:M48 family metallopeptidase [Pseudochryseolinea flava]RAW00261.1 peptidase M48 [Pseudochryseolinea flava]